MVGVGPRLSHIPIGLVALERFAINGGAAFALAADLLVVGREAYLQVGEIRQGMAAPMNLAWLLARHPASVAEQIALTGRRFVGPIHLDGRQPVRHPSPHPAVDGRITVGSD